MLARFALILVLLFPAARAEISFRAQIAPILLEKCVTCHSPEKSKGGFQLETFSNLSKPGDSKKNPITAGSPERSHLLELLTTTDADDRMPQKADPLPASEIAIIKQWITEGAKFDGASPDQNLALIIPFLPGPEPIEHYPFPQPILALAWSPDGKTLATSGYHEALLWDDSGKLTGRISRLPQRIHGLAFLNDGQLAIAAGVPGKSGQLLIAKQNETPKLLARIGDVFTCLALNSDRTLLAAGGADNSIRLIEISSGKELLNIQQHADWVTALAFSRDGKQIASASRDRTARIFDLKGGLIETYVEHDKPLFAVAFADDGKKVFSGGREKKVHAWQINEAKKIAEYPALDGDILALCVAGESLYASGADKKIRQFSAKDRKEIRTLTGHTDWIYTLAYNAQTKRLASGSYNGEIRIWNTETGESIVTFKALP